jgi:WD40 repeat protein/predicted Ser/Thr protein kinase
MTDSTMSCPTCGAPIDAERMGSVCAACLLLGAAAEAPAEATLGRLAGYELIEVIARGGMGIVYRARQSDPAREVALKALPGAELMSEEARQRFKIEARAMARLEHPAILPIYELGEEDGTPFFTMKLAAGGSLANRLGHYTGKWRESAELITHIADAVHYAHERGVLHRDLKPGNILLDENSQVFVSDFGLAKIIGEEANLTRTIALMGTPNYLAPELTHGGKGAATTACDVWSLGVMLYELLSGHAPFRGDNLATVLRQLNEVDAPPLLREVPRDLQVIVKKALQKAPTQRYASAHDLAEDLRRWLRGDPIHARPTPLLEHAILWSRRHPALAGMAAALVVVLAGASVLLWKSNHQLGRSLAAEHASREDAETRLKDALIAEGMALVRSHDLTSRGEILRLIDQLVKRGHSGLEVRNLAVQALGKIGVEPGAVLPTGFATLSSSLDFSPDLRFYATGLGRRDSRAFRLHDGSTGKVLHQIPATAEGNNFHFSRDGQWVAVRLRDRSLQVHRLASPEKAVFRISTRSGFWNVSVAFDPAGRHWLYADGTPVVRRHEASDASAEADAVVFTAPAAVRSLSLSPDGGLLALSWVGGWGLLEVGSGKLLWEKNEPPAGCPAAWQPNGRAVLQALEADHQIVLVEPRTGRVITRFLSHEGSISKVAFHPTAPLVFSSGSDIQLIVWDAISGRALAHHPCASRGFAIADDGRRIAFSPAQFSTVLHDLTVPRIWRIWQAPHVYGAKPLSLDLTPDGKRLVSLVFANRPQFRVWETDSGRYWLGADGTLPYSSLSCLWLGDSTLVTAGANDDGRLLRLKPLDGDEDTVTVKESEPLPGEVFNRTSDRTGVIVRNRKDHSAVVLGNDGLVRLKIPATGHFNTSDVSPDGRWFTAQRKAQDGYEVRQVADGKVVLSFALRRYARPFFTPDARALISAGPTEVIVHETDTWRELARWPVDVLHEGHGWAACSPDGSLLAVRHAEGVIALHDTATWQPLVHLRLPGPFYLRSGGVRLIWTADSQRLLVLSQGHRVTEWDVKALREELGRLGLDWKARHG